MSLLMNLLLGLLFGVGLVVSGMSDPAKVLNFLDLAGTWDPSLAFVMAGGVLVAFVGYRLVFSRGKPLLDGAFHLPTSTKIDGRLVAGAAIFGIGWGLGGFCPGPGDHRTRPRSAGNAGVSASDGGWFVDCEARRRGRGGPSPGTHFSVSAAGGWIADWSPTLDDHHRDQPENGGHLPDEGGAAAAPLRGSPQGECEKQIVGRKPEMHGKRCRQRQLRAEHSDSTKRGGNVHSAADQQHVAPKQRCKRKISIPARREKPAETGCSGVGRAVRVHRRGLAVLSRR